MSLEMDSLYIDPDTADIKTWLEKRGLGEFAKSFDKHKIDFEVSLCAYVAQSCVAPSSFGGGYYVDRRSFP